MIVQRTSFAQPERIEMTEDREAAVRAVLSGLIDAWSAGDATAYARLFAEDAATSRSSA
jgi:ketosteroid isomerase-like protein